MWPFTRKPKPPSPWDEARDRIQALAAAFPVGATLEYLGVELSVVSHWSYIHYRVPPRAVLTCRYRNDRGEILSLDLSYAEVQSLARGMDLAVVLP